MTTLTDTPLRTRRDTAASLRRATALARGELRLLTRNRTAMITALLLPVAMVGFLGATGIGDQTDVPPGAMLTTLMVCFVLLFVVYYNLVSVYVARREELVLKRLRVGEATDAEILTGGALPSLLIALVQTVVVAIGVAVVVGAEAPVNVLLPLLGLTVGAVVFVLLAGASTAFTRNVEMAQVSTMPVLFICMLGSGMMVPISVFPDTLAQVLRFLPMTPVVELSNLGLAGLTWDGTAVDLAGSFEAAMVPMAILLVWLALGTWALRRWFRWEPRV